MSKLFNRLILVILVLFIMNISVEAESPFKVVQLTDNIYQLSTDEGAYTTNSLVYVGSEGVLLVDANAAEYADEFKKIIDSYEKGFPKYIINTHRHVEHIGGNAVFGDSPTVISHYLLPSKLKSGSYIFDEFPKSTYPNIVVIDSLILNFNDEKIRIIEMGGSHDDNEIMIHFTKSKIVHLSSICNGLNFPSIDADGDLNKFPELIQKAIDMLPKDVTIVSGHNNNCSWKDLHAYREMLINTKAIVQKGIDEGKDVKTMQEEKVFNDYELYNQSYVSTDEWIEYNYDVITNKDEKKKQIYKPLYYALQDGGVEKAIQKYNELKSKSNTAYNISEIPLLVIGDKLQGKGKNDLALGILEFCLKEYPEGKYAYYVHYIMSTAHKDLGDKKNALKHCNKSMELKEEFQAAKKLLEEINNM